MAEGLGQMTSSGGHQTLPSPNRPQPNLASRRPRHVTCRARSGNIIELVLRNCSPCLEPHLLFPSDSFSDFTVSPSAAVPTEAYTNPDSHDRLDETAGDVTPGIEITLEHQEQRQSSAFNVHRLCIRLFLWACVLM